MYNPRLSAENSLQISFSHDGDGSGTRLRVWGRSEKNRENLANFGLYVRELPPRKSSWTFEGREIVEDSNSASCFQLASGWLRECIENHPACRSSWKQASGTSSGSSNDLISAFCPTRLIDVGPADGSLMPYLRVMRNRKDEENSPITWIALSHRWGLTRPMTTMTKNLQQMRQGIHLASLPSTFRDAITITRNLGQRYLWIDSLCIIQDLKEDWIREASMMGEVYGHSFLTIAAHNSPDCHSGILTKRLDDEMSVHPISNSPYDFLGVSKEMPKWEIILRHDLLPWAWAVDGVESSLSARGWVLQESVLSPRTLLYCKDQMYWECRTIVLAEGSRSPLKVLKRREGSGIELNQNLITPNLLPDPPPGNTGLESSLSRLFGWGTKGSARENHNEISESSLWKTSKKSFISLYDSSPLEICKAWEILVVDYSARRLTQPDDRLKAIAGLAAHFEARLNCSYVAGIFQYQPHSTLLWRVFGHERTDSYRVNPEYPCPIRAYHRAPSWSWLSIEGSVRFDTVDLSHRDPRYKPYTAEIKLPITKTNGTDNLDSLRPSILEVRGLWRHSSAYQIADRCHKILILRDPSKFRGRVVVCKFDFLDEQDIWSRAEHRTFSILILLSSGDHEDFGDETLYGLILEPAAANKGSDTYRRIGLATVEPYFLNADETTKARGGHDQSQWIEATVLIS